MSPSSRGNRSAKPLMGCAGISSRSAGSGGRPGSNGGGRGVVAINPSGAAWSPAARHASYASEAYVERRGPRLGLRRNGAHAGRRESALEILRPTVYQCTRLQLSAKASGLFRPNSIVAGPGANRGQIDRQTDRRSEDEGRRKSPRAASCRSAPLPGVCLSVPIGNRAPGS